MKTIELCKKAGLFKVYYEEVTLGDEKPIILQTREMRRVLYLIER